MSERLARFLLLLAAAALVSLGAALPARADPARAPIGDLVLDYDDAAWLVTKTGAASYRLNCRSEAVCLNASVAATVIPDGAYCDETAAYERAREVFPLARSHAVNMRRVGDLALFVASSGRGYELPYDHTIGPAAFACLSREGTLYEFASVTETTDLPFGHDASVFALLSGLTAPPASGASLSLGGIALNFGSDRWSAEESGPGAWLLHCLPPSCDPATPISVIAEPGATCPSNLAAPDPFEVAGERTKVLSAGAEGLVFAFEVRESRCRAMSPSGLAACTVSDGVRYSLATPYQGGCYHGGRGIPDQLFIDLLRSASVEPR